MRAQTPQMANEPLDPVLTKVKKKKQKRKVSIKRINYKINSDGTKQRIKLTIEDGQLSFKPIKVRLKKRDVQFHNAPKSPATELTNNMTVGASSTKSFKKVKIKRSRQTSVDDRKLRVDTVGSDHDYSVTTDLQSAVNKTLRRKNNALIRSV